MKLVICTSASFYRQAVDVSDELASRNIDVVLPRTANLMREKNDFDVTHYKTWYENPDDYGMKANLIRAHFDEIARGDAILVLNYEKHGRANYIGPNVLMEMGLAFYLHKSIYLLNNIPVDYPFEEEIKGSMPIVLDGNLTPLTLDKS